MIFKYVELKECVLDDFEVFLNMGFDEKQTYFAVLNEYEHGKDFCQIECICIHIFLVLNYKKNGMIYDFIIEKLENLLENVKDDDIKKDLENEYQWFLDDITKIKE